MKTVRIVVSIDPRNLRSYAAVDHALDQLRKQVVDHAASAIELSTIVLTFEMGEGKVAA